MRKSYLRSGNLEKTENNSILRIERFSETQFVVSNLHVTLPDLNVNVVSRCEEICLFSLRKFSIRT